MKFFIINFRKLQKNTPIYFISPLWVPTIWQPEGANIKLEDYRKTLAEVVKKSNDPNIKFIDGSKLIDHDKKYFDRVAVHPNNIGFKMMAEQLAKEINI